MYEITETATESVLVDLKHAWLKLRFPFFERERPRAARQRHQMVVGHFIVNAENLEPHS